LFYKLILYRNRTRASNNSTKNHFSEIFVKHFWQNQTPAGMSILLQCAAQYPGFLPSAGTVTGCGGLRNGKQEGAVTMVR
jgi:hypothetical protein